MFPTQKEGFHVVIIGVAVIVALFSILGTLGIRERIFPMQKEKYNFGNIKDILGARPVLVHFLTTLLTSIGSGVSTGALVFFFLYALKRPDLFSVTALSYVLGVIVAVLAAPALIRRFGRKVCLLFTLLLSLSGSLVMFLSPTSLPLIFIIVPMLASPAVGMNMVLSYGIQADNMDFIEWKRGYRAEATVASMNSFIVKAAGGVGSAIGAYLLVFYHYVPNAETQAVETIRGFYTINFAIPGIFTLIALLVWIFGYPLTKKITAQMLAELAERRRSSGGAGAEERA
jgi:Na+/melibiose symporter-like transporter